MTHVFRPYQQTSHFIPFSQLFILHTVLQDINAYMELLLFSTSFVISVLFGDVDMEKMASFCVTGK